VLRQLAVRNLAVVESLEVDLDDGLTVFTGETGAGKSILVGALGLALGDRADNAMIRSGAESATVTAVFDIEDCAPAGAFLEQQGIEAAPECIVRRQISSDGRSRGFVNDTPVAMGMLRELGACLVDIHGQNDHHSLLRRPVQRELLDAFAGHERLLEQAAAAHRDWQEANDALERLSGSGGSVEAERELLRFQIREMEGLPITPDAVAALEREHARLANLSRLMEGVNGAIACLRDEQGAAGDTLSAAIRALGDLARIDPALEKETAILRDALAMTDDVAVSLRRYLAGLDGDPGRLEAADAELARLHELARKHRCPMDGLGAKREEMARRFDQLEHLESEVARLEDRRRAAAGAYSKAASALHDSRCNHAARLDATISEALRELGMPDAEFHAAVRLLEDAAPRAIGPDEVEFLVSANAGQAPLPLAKVASGGELSRISLAIQVVTAVGVGARTLVFDEVDAGIGGRVAEIVGQKLRALGAERQVLCITHLPQVASLGRHHLKVSKDSAGQATHTRVVKLDDAERALEIARMLGGVKVTERALAHAREMLLR
jgi:DNA repair protein RecN (Recombination protein N)